MAAVIMRRSMGGVAVQGILLVGKVRSNAIIYDGNCICRSLQETSYDRDPKRPILSCL